jgi:hypothetical protein
MSVLQIIFLPCFDEKFKLAEIQSVMKKLFIIACMTFLVYGGQLAGQSFDWNLRGGVNLMKSYTTSKSIAAYYHVGFQAGVRITNWGFYGEMVYSLQENQYQDKSPIAYVNPALVVKGFWRKHIFVEVGACYLNLVGDSGVDPDTRNPDKKGLALAGIGTQFSRFQFSLRSTLQPSTSYGVVQLTAAVKF